MDFIFTLKVRINSIANSVAHHVPGQSSSLYFGFGGQLANIELICEEYFAYHQRFGSILAITSTKPNQMTSWTLISNKLA